MKKKFILMEAHHTINFKISFHLFRLLLLIFPSVIITTTSYGTFWFISLERFFLNSTSVLIIRVSLEEKMFQYWNSYRWCHRANTQIMRIDFINHHSDISKYFEEVEMNLFKERKNKHAEQKRRKMFVWQIYYFWVCQSTLNYFHRATRWK
jgi:hypothetical protein